MDALNQHNLALRLNLTDRNDRLLEERGVILRLPSGEYNLPDNLERYRLFRDRDLQTVADRIEDAAKTVSDILASMEAEPNVKSRRKIMRERGVIIGRFTGWLDLSVAMQPEPLRALLKRLADSISATALNTALDLCFWQLATDNRGSITEHSPPESESRICRRKWQGKQNRK
jgi:hypothetical protein